MSRFSAATATAAHWFSGWRRVWLIAAALSALPAAYFANRALLETTLELHTRLIVSNQLWETDAAYAGSARDWTRFAAWLLSTRQLLDRVRAQDPARADAIEEEFRRDVFLAYGGVIARYLAGWGVPLGLAFAAGLLRERRRAHHSA